MKEDKIRKEKTEAVISLLLFYFCTQQYIIINNKILTKRIFDKANFEN